MRLKDLFPGRKVGFLMVPWPFLKIEGLRSDEKLLLAFLASKIKNDQDFAYPGGDLMASIIGGCRQTVWRAIQGLVEAGYISEVVENYKGRANGYRLNLDKIRALVPLKSIPTQPTPVAANPKHPVPVPANPKQTNWVAEYKRRAATMSGLDEDNFKLIVRGAVYAEAERRRPGITINRSVGNFGVELKRVGFCEQEVVEMLGIALNNGCRNEP